MLIAGAHWNVALPAPAQSSGLEVYMNSCVACHGADGQGVLPGVPDLAAADGFLARSDATLLQRIRDGYQSLGSPLAMPPKGGNPSLTDDDIKAVVEYMKKTFAR